MVLFIGKKKGFRFTGKKSWIEQIQRWQKNVCIIADDNRSINRYSILNFHSFPEREQKKMFSLFSKKKSLFGAMNAIRHQ